MFDFKGFDDWIEIFRGGKQTDSQGRVHDGNKIIEYAVENFDINKYEPPIVIGHPKDNEPAYGWVKNLKVISMNGVKSLLAKFKQVNPTFEDMVKKGLFKKRSASFYKDGALRHVGFLGAAPPAIKGLTDIKFKKGGIDMIYDFVSSSDPGEELTRLTNELLRTDKTMNFTEAFSEVQKENPDLAQAYAQEIFKKGGNK